MKYAALLRGINVGGKNKVAMADLRSVVEACGYTGVKTYINSGNVVFDAAKADDRKIAGKIHDQLLEDLGLDISVMVRSVAEIEAIIAKNPYSGQFENHKDLHVFFLADELSNENSALLLEKNSDAEMISVDGRTIYYLLRISIVDSVLGKGFIDRKLKVPATARNWRTVEKLAELGNG